MSKHARGRSGGSRPHSSTRFSALWLAAATVVLAMSVVTAAAAPGAGNQSAAGATPRQARALESDRTGVEAPIGLAFSSASESFYVIAAGPGGNPADTEIVKLTPFALSPVSDRAGSARIAAALRDPINMTFDTRGNRLLLLDAADRLLEVRAEANGDLDPSTLVRRDALRLDLRDPQGMAVDPASGVVFVLDAAQPRIIRIEPAADGSFDAATTSDVELSSSGMSAVRGLAFDPSTGHLQVGSAQGLVELTTAGAVVTTRELSRLGLARAAGMAFAPSGDLTDASSELSVYVADSGAAPSPGQIVELSLAPLAALASIDVTAALVNTVNMGGLSPPSTDPCGIAHVPASDRLLISDCEVEETVNGITHFQGANVWELNRIGLAVNRTANISNVPPGVVVPVTNEPGGAAFNPNNGHYYFSADDGKKVYDVDPGVDGLVGAAGDTVSSFDTLAVGNSDPEGIAYDTFGGHLFVADGLNREIYEFTSSGTLVNHFDTAQYGVHDPESVEFNPVSGTLFILSDRANTAPPVPIIVETTRTGALIRTIDASASNTFKPAGLAYGPASDGSAVKRFYILDRGIDNNVDPNAVDGKLYELTAPTPDPPSNLPPVVNAGLDRAATLPASAALDGTVSDDGNPMPPSLTTTWTLVSGPSTVTFGNANAVDTTASVPIPGIYVVRLTANDGQYAVSDDVTLTFTGSGSVGVVDVRISVAGDDAEEVAGTGLVQRGDGDLDMMIDTADTKQVVGLRFNGITIPQGATISNAYLQFQADESHSVATTLTIKGQAADNAPGFTTVTFDLSSRPTTTASAAWSPAAWLAVGDAGLAQRSTNLASIVQEIAGRSGWASGNSLALFVTGSGRRVAVSHNQIPAAAALLHVEWTTGGGNAAPVITSNGGGPTATVSPVENQTAVTDVNATDPDPNTLTYSIAGGADAARFTIVPTTGVMAFLSAPNFELPTDAGANNVYDVVVSVSDGNSGSDSQAIAATVVNINEFAPVISSDGGGTTAALSRPENATAVTDVNATDGDGDPLTYSVSGGPDAARFTIVPSSGVLTFLVAPDFELPTDTGANNVYNLIVSASDGSLSDAQSVAVTVTNVNETGSPPTITSDGGGASAALSRSENSTAVTDVNATDPDVGDTLTYSITAGADMTAFTIVPSTGVLTFLNAPSFELPTDIGLNNVYDVTVQVSDGSRTDTQAIAVTVTNLNEFAPVITTDGGGGSAALSRPENQSVVTDVDATDGDLQSITYSITAGADALDFTINATTGLLSFTATPDFEAPADTNLDNVYEVTVTASDGSLSDTQALTISVTDVVETGGSPLYFAVTAAVTLGGIPVANEDVVYFDGTTFSLAFDGSDVGITNLSIDALTRISASSILLSFTADQVVPGIPGTVDDSDVVRFDGTLGAVTSGTFSMYFDGSDVALTVASEDVDAVELLPNGHLLLSTTGGVAVTGVSAVDEDILEFTPSSIGDVTAGTFAFYFDGSDVGLNTNSGEDVDGVAVDSGGNTYLSTLDLFSVIGVTGEDDDVFVFDSLTLGSVTTGSYLPTLYLDGSAFGLTANDVVAIDLP
ncbi:MAG: cadherin domain-containing protein [Gaiellaceae bacterium]